MTATGTVCTTCGTEPSRVGARYCDACGSPLAAVARNQAEYKQVTVLFADVVHSMDIAAAVGTERLREIMTALLDRSAAVVRHYSGTVDKFTGDGIMAVFGAPMALEDHAFRACLAALEIQTQTVKLAAEVKGRDDIDLQLRIGLNSGQVIVGEIGSSTVSYTAIGEHVGMAQRMESVAPPGGVMLSEPTARLVKHTVVLGEPELVHIKGGHTPVRARRLLSIGEHQPPGRSESALVGRTGELNTVAAILQGVIGGTGCVVNVMGPAGIGKSRLVRETAAMAASRGIPISTAYCESHIRDLQFRVLARLLRAVFGISDLGGGEARARVRDRLPDTDGEDLLLLNDLLGIGDITVSLPEIAPEARRRRVTALITAAVLARNEPAAYVIEDAHWIDEASESMLCDFLAVIPQTPSLVLITYRPEYHGALSRLAGVQTIELRPLSDAYASALTAALLGTDPSLAQLAARVTARADGNPFFAEEMVRDLAERGVLHGHPGAYRLCGDIDDVEVPPTVQATIGARIDRLGTVAKRTLNAAAVIGSRFDTDLLSDVVDNADVAPLIGAELLDQVSFTPRADYAFRHPLIRAVAYESQLKSDRARLHRCLAAAIDAHGSGDENAALIAEHLEAAGDLHEAFAWHMRAGTWSTNRDIAAAHTSWRRARQVADQLSDDDPDRISMRIAPRTLLCGTAFRVGGSSADTGFGQLRDLCTAAGDQRSLAIGMTGLVMAQSTNAHRLEASRLATENSRLLESIGDPTLTVALSPGAMVAKHEASAITELLQIAQRVIDLADGDPATGNLIIGSPLTLAIAMRGVTRCCLGITGWKDDLHRATTTAGAFDPLTQAAVMWFTYATAIPYGMLLPDASALRHTAETLALAEQSGDDFALDTARTTRGITLVHRDGSEREAGFGLLTNTRESASNGRFSLTIPAIADINIARGKARLGDIDGAIELARSVVDDLLASGGCIWTALATDVFVEALLRRGGDGDLKDARAAMERLAAVPSDPGLVLHDITLLPLRALLARTQGDDASYRNYRDRYRVMATSLGFEGHIARAETMT